MLRITVLEIQMTPFRYFVLGMVLAVTGCDAISSLGGNDGKGGNGGAGDGGGAATTTDGGDEDSGGGDGDGGVDLTTEPLYEWALATCEFLGECCTDCDGPYGWGEEISTLEECVEFALGFGVVYVDDELVPGCPGPDYDALVSCIQGLECGQSATFDCPDFDEDIIPCE